MPTRPEVHENYPASVNGRVLDTRHDAFRALVTDRT
ncbi:protein of unknown function [Streptomyces sp. KY75]|nr:protein of unknown function [Streptomyces sp. KY70]CAD5994232.1 protein of unknown function [Streptomyces sp. KY75]